MLTTARSGWIKNGKDHMRKDQPDEDSVKKAFLRLQLRPPFSHTLLKVSPKGQRYSMVRYGKIRYGMVSMVCCGVIRHQSDVSSRVNVPLVVLGERAGETAEKEGKGGKGEDRGMESEGTMTEKVQF